MGHNIPISITRLLFLFLLFVLSESVATGLNFINILNVFPLYSERFDSPDASKHTDIWLLLFVIDLEILYKQIFTDSNLFLWHFILPNNFLLCTVILEAVV